MFFQSVAGTLTFAGTLSARIAPRWRQQSFQGYADNGGEGAATPKAAINSGWTQSVDVNFRVRILVQEIAGADPAVVKSVWLQYNLNAGGWNNIHSKSDVVESDGSPHIVHGADSTQQIGSGAYLVNNNWLTDLNGQTEQSTDAFSDNEAECEFCLQIKSGDVNHGDSIQLRLSGMQVYTQTVTITVNEPDYFQSAAGTLSTAGALSGKANKVLAGALASAGDLIKRSPRIFAGTLTTAGVNSKKLYQALAGILAFFGFLRRGRPIPLTVRARSAALTLVARSATLTIEDR